MPTLRELGQSQQFDWGSIRWLAEPGSGGVERVSAGLLTFNANSVQEEHVHTGYEQIMYIISGHGRHCINGESGDLLPGELVHIPPFARHTVYNESNEPVTLVSLYFPLRSQKVDASVEKIGENETDAGHIWSFLDMDSLAVLLDKLSQALRFRLTLLDTRGNPIIDSGKMPFCAMVHEASRGRYCKGRILAAIRERESARPVDTRGRLFICCNSIASMLIPVFDNKSIAGYIKCGEVFLTKSNRDALDEPLPALAEKYGLDPATLAAAAADVRVELKSVLYAAAEATLAIANYITEMAASAHRRKELDKSRLSLIREQMASARLEKALQEADFKLLQSQVNPHFLFNALSTVAQMAYMEGADKVADIIWSLSDLLRFTLRRTEELIAFHEELKLLGDYLKIQEARFGDRLAVDWDIEPGLENVPIPCMLFQPLVENAIIHGLEPLLRPGRISIAARAGDGAMFCTIRDNGMGFEPRRAAERTDRIGLASVRNRLQYYFADACSFAIESEPGKGTTVNIRVPLGAAEKRNA